MKNFLNKFKWFIIGAAVVVAGTVYAYNVTIPQSTVQGTVPIGNSNGTYNAGQLLSGSGIGIDTSTPGQITIRNTAAGAGATTTITAGLKINGPDFTFASTSDTNLGLQVTANGSTLTFAPQWIGNLAVNRGGTGTTTWQSGSIPYFNGTNLTENNSKFLWDSTNLWLKTPITDFGGQVYNVLAYGAKCDGTTDDVTAINNAITAANSAGGGTVLLCRGTTKVSSTRITPQNNVTLAGQGKDATTILGNRSSDYVIYYSNTTTPVTNWTVKDLTINVNNATSSSAIRYDGASSTVTSNVKIKNVPTGGWGMVLGAKDSVNDPVVNFNNKITDTDFDTHAGTLEMLLLFNSQYTQLTRDLFTNNGGTGGGRVGLGLWQKTYDTTITDSQWVNDAGTCFYYSLSTERTSLINPVFNNCGNAIKGANVSDNGAFGTTQAQSLHITNPTITGGSNSTNGAGIELGAVNNATVIGGTIEKMQIGIDVDKGAAAANATSTNLTITGVKIRNNNQSNNVFSLHPGIFFNGGGNIYAQVTDNEIYDDQASQTQLYPISLDGPGTFDHISIKGNRLTASSSATSVALPDSAVLGSDVKIFGNLNYTGNSPSQTPWAITEGGTNTTTAPSTKGQLLAYDGIATYGPTNLVAGSNITVTTSTPGQITIAASGGATPCTTTGYSVQYNNAGNLGCISTLLTDGTLVGYNATSSTIGFNIQGSTNVDPFQVASSSGTSLLYVKGNGNVGINNNNPSARLQIDQSGVTGYLQMGDGWKMRSNNGIWEAQTLFAGKSFRFLDTGGNTRDEFTADSGKLGINVSSPSYYLEVATSMPSSVLTAEIQNTAGAANGDVQLFLGTRNTAHDISVGASIYANRNETPTAGSTDLLFKNSLGTNLITNLIIKANGLVGIGSTSPIATLSVQGTSSLPSTNVLVIASNTGTSLLTVASNGSTTLSSLGSGFVKSASGSLYTDTNTYLQSISLTGGATITGSAFTFASASPDTTWNIICATSTCTFDHPNNLLTTTNVSGTNGQLPYFVGANTINSASTMLYNGTVFGMNATSSTISFNIQGTAGTNNPFNVASSSGTSILTVTNMSRVGINTSTPAVGFVIQNAQGTNDAFRIASSSGATIDIFDYQGHLQIGTTTMASQIAIQGAGGQTTDYFDIASSSGLTVFSVSPNSEDRFSIGSTTPVANFTVVASSTAATTTIQFGDPAASKGACIKLMRGDGTPVYLWVNGGSTTLNISASANACSSVTGF